MNLSLTPSPLDTNLSPLSIFSALDGFVQKGCSTFLLSLLFPFQNLNFNSHKKENENLH